MFKDGSFLLQVILLFALTFAGALWVMDGAPVPTITTRPLQPSPEIPSMAEYVAKGLEERRTGDPDREVTGEKAELKGLFRNAERVAFASSSYRRDECDGERRGEIVGAVNDLADYRSRHPDAERSKGGRFLTDGAERAISSLFKGSLLTLDDFSAKTRNWLETFVQPGSQDKAQRIRQCQAKG